MKGISRISKDDLEKLYSETVGNNIEKEVEEVLLDKSNEEIIEEVKEMELDKVEEVVLKDESEEVVPEDNSEEVDTIDKEKLEKENQEIIEKYELVGKNKTQKITILYDGGFTISKISSLLEIRYQHVYNTLKRKGSIVGRKSVDEYVEKVDTEVLELDVESSI